MARIEYSSHIWEEMQVARARGAEMGLTLLDTVGVEGTKRVVIDIINGSKNDEITPSHERYAYVDGIMNAIYTAEQAALAEAMGASRNG
jgi:hypothetical protein